MKRRARTLVAAGALLGAAGTATVGSCVGPGLRTFTVGVTHGQHTPYPTAGYPATVELDVLRRIPLQNQHIMGWGALSPEPSPGVYDWTSLDERMRLIESTGAEPVITLCCAPDWMKGGAAGTTDWTKLEVAPLESHYDDFSALAARVAARYPNVRYFQVWNELKGFWSPAKGRWDHEAYTDLYNRVYRAVKAVRPDAQVGGPYAPLELYQRAPVPSSISGPWGTVDRRALDAIDYWLAHNDGADFIALDGWTTTRDAGYLTEPVSAAGVFEAVTRWLRARTTLPIWWSELYAADASWPLETQERATVAAIRGAQAGGASVVLLWSPQATWNVCHGCLWSDPRLGTVTVTPLAGQVAPWKE